MLLSDPSAPLTIARAAEAVGAAPMSLYRHFADRDDLVTAVAQHVFAGTRPPVDDETPWQDVVHNWMTAVFDQARGVPRLMQLIASGESADWLLDASYLASAFERAGIHDDQLVTEATYWVATTTMGHAMLHSVGGAEAATQDGWDLRRLDAEDAARLSRLMPHLAELRERGFERIVQWTITALEQMISERSVAAAQ